MSVSVLIVEDEQIIAADLGEKLKRMGCTIVGTAASGEEAIELAERVRPQLVMMDIKLRGDMDGTMAARAIQDRTGSKIIFVTAFPGVFLRDSSAMPDPAICLSKPFSKRQLEAVLGAAFGQAAPDSTPSS